MKIQEFVIVELFGDVENEVRRFPYSALPQTIIDCANQLAQDNPDCYYKVIMRDLDEVTVYTTKTPVNSRA